MRVALIILIVCFSLLLLPSLHADTVVYNEWIHSGDSFTINKPDFKDDIFTVTYFDFGSDATNKLLVKRNNRGYSLVLGDCRFETFYKYCFNETSWRYEKEAKNPGHLEYRGGEEYPGLHVLVYQIGPEIEVKRESSMGNTINLNEETRLAITLKNKGDKRAEPVIYSEFPPASLNVYSSTGFTKDFSVQKPSLIWQGLLAPAQYVTMAYRIKPLTYDAFKINASLTYEYENKTYNVTVTPISFTVSKPFDFTISLSPATLGIQEVTTIKITVKNLDKFRPLEGEVSVTLPHDVELLQQQYQMSNEGDVYTFPIEIIPLESYVQTITLRGLTTGTYNISTFGDLKFPNEEIIVKASSLFKVEGVKVTPELRFVGEEDVALGSSIESGKTFRVVAELTNKDEVQVIKNINAKMYKQHHNLEFRFFSKLNKLAIQGFLCLNFNTIKYE
jgi:hypothetical protein